LHCLITVAGPASWPVLCLSLLLLLLLLQLLQQLL
jgi:hypothetical protein